MKKYVVAILLSSLLATGFANASTIGKSTDTASQQFWKPGSVRV